jgi:[ribosomal protein S5]-alanine N-acetyltransferase
MALFGLTRSVCPEPLLRGEGLYLRPATPADFSPWARLRSASRAFLERWEPTWPEDDLTQAAFRRRLRRQDEDIARDEAYGFLIFEPTSDQLLGGITLGGIRRGVSQSGTLGYWMGAPHAGKGHMTRSVAATVEFAFSKLRLHRVEAACIPDNAPSIALLERNGFQREGYARSYLKIDGAWRDHVLFALVESDMRARPPASRFVQG